MQDVDRKRTYLSAENYFSWQTLPVVLVDTVKLFRDVVQSWDKKNFFCARVVDDWIACHRLSLVRHRSTRSRTVSTATGSIRASIGYVVRHL